VPLKLLPHNTRTPTVGFSLSGTATVAADYNGPLISGSVTIPLTDGSGSVEVAYSSVDDPLVEDPETVEVTLIDGVDYDLSPTAFSATGQVCDDDGGEPQVNLIAHRTGGKFGDPIPESVENEADPEKYLVLTNNDYEEAPTDADDFGVDYADDVAEIPTGSTPADDDLARITLKHLAGEEGTVEFQMSNPAAVRLFKDDGTIFYEHGTTSASVLSFDVSSPTGYLGDILNGDVDLWLEGLTKDSDLKLSLVYNDTSTGEVYRDDVHMTLAEWTFRGLAGEEIFSVAPLWKDALLTAATDGAWQDPVDAGDAEDGSFFKVQIDGLTFNSTLSVASEEYPNDSYVDALSGMSKSKNFSAVYNSDVYLPPADTTLTAAERNLIKNNLTLNAVHNDGAKITLETGDELAPTDRFERRMLADKLLDVQMKRTGRTSDEGDLFVAGGSVQVTVTSAVTNPNWRWEATTTDGQTFSSAHGDQPFTFTLQGAQAGTYILEVRQGPADPQNPAQIRPGHPWFTRARYRVVGQAAELDDWYAKAWRALRFDNTAGSIPADATWLNRRITELYAMAYNANKDLKYPGMAAFPSKLVGDSMTAAAEAGWLGALAAGRETVRNGYRYLAERNWAIYISMYPTALAYSSDPQNHPNGNIQAVQNMLPAGNGLRQAWEKLHNARLNQNQEEIWAAAVEMMDYEQRVVLHGAIADTPEKRQFWTSFTQNHGARIRAPYAGAARFVDVVPNPDYGNAGHRMQWFQQELYSKAKQWLEQNPQGVDVQKLLKGEYGV
jgi:hypothetical protein